jgi:hypothetical protein
MPLRSVLRQSLSAASFALTLTACQQEMPTAPPVPVAVIPPASAPSIASPPAAAPAPEAEGVTPEAGADAPPAARPTSGPEVWEAAYRRALGDEPQLVEPPAPWPDCATSLVRRPLEAEHKRRQDAARAAHKAALDAWRKASQPVRDAAAAGFFVTAPSAGAPFNDKLPAAAGSLRAALGALSPTVCHVRDVRAATSSPTTEEKAAAKAANQPLSGPSGYHILCGSTADGGPTFLVTVPARFVAAKLAGETLTGWRFEPEGHLAEALRGRVATIGVGEQLEITGIGRLTRGARDPGFGRGAFGETQWAVDFTRACPHEGAGCTFNDGKPVAVVRALPPSVCGTALADKADDLFMALVKMSPNSPDWKLLEGWISTLAPESNANKGLLFLKELETGDLDGAAAMCGRLEPSRRANCLGFVAELQLKKPETAAAGLANLDAAIALEPRSAWRLRAGGMALQNGDSAGAVTRLKALVDAAKTAAEAKDVEQAAGLLKFAGDAAAAATAEAKAASLKAR